MLTPGLRSASPRSIQATNRAACMGLFRASFSVPTSRPPPDRRHTHHHAPPSPFALASLHSSRDVDSPTHPRVEHGKTTSHQRMLIAEKVIQIVMTSLPSRPRSTITRSRVSARAGEGIGAAAGLPVRQRGTCSAEGTIANPGAHPRRDPLRCDRPPQPDPEK